MKFLNLFQNFNLKKILGLRKKKEAYPELISDSEKITRVLLYPQHIHKNKGTLMKSAFRPPAGLDEISVLRHDYSGADFCKEWGRKIESPENGRNYFGVACLRAEEIREVKADVFYSPQDDNPYHGDIKIGYVPEQGKSLPAEIQLKIDTLAKKARLYKDSSPTIGGWSGGDII
tara:strand:- start:1849 stop:2370 length:522 start_codon:yes stop_codon:yes gene_type:complete